MFFISAVTEVSVVLAELVMLYKTEQDSYTSQMISNEQILSSEKQHSPVAQINSQRLSPELSLSGE